MEKVSILVVDDKVAVVCAHHSRICRLKIVVCRENSCEIVALRTCYRGVAVCQSKGKYRQERGEQNENYQRVFCEFYRLFHKYKYNQIATLSQDNKFIA